MLATAGPNAHLGTEAGDLALDLLADMLGAEVIAIDATDNSLAATGPCSPCGSPTTVYGPNGSPLRPVQGWRSFATRQGHRADLKVPANDSRF